MLLRTTALGLGACVMIAACSAPAAPKPLTTATPAPTSVSPSPSPSTAAPAPTPTDTGTAQPGDRAPQPGVPLPDGFVPEVLPAGSRPPQFVVVSFDGGGWDEKWDSWLALGERVPFRFTVFLSGVYLLSGRTRTAYHPPGRAPGTADIRWRSAADLPVEITNLNRAVAAGDEIGTHFNGHFCAGSGSGPGGGSWSSAAWNAELTQFFDLLQDYRRNNPGADLPALNVTPADIQGSRTPCLEGNPGRLYPVLARHGLSYDSSFTRPGLTWPTQDPRTGIWRFGMHLFPVHGTLPDGRSRLPVTTMDYNYWYAQRRADDAAPAQAARDSAQVLATYLDLYRTAYDGNRAPLVLGNHFEDWNHNAYSDALSRFVTQVCSRPQTRCVPFQDVVAWMQVQPPAVLTALQHARTASDLP